jgi:cytochrome c oxidase subunit II
MNRFNNLIRRRILSFLLLPLTSCGGPQSILRPQGPAAGKLAQMGWVVFILFSVVTLIVLVLLLWAALRRRGSLDTHEPYNEGGGQSWVLIGGFAIPLVILCGLFVYTLQGMTEFPLHGGNHVHPHADIQIIGHQRWWEVHYLSGETSHRFVTANEIHIPAGQPTDIELTSADVIHAFWVPALHGKIQLIPGQTNYIRIQAEHPGSFPGQCGVYCGEQHAHMRLLVVAQAPDEYQAWYEGQLKEAAEPQGAEAVHGREVFESAACALCHTVRGTAAEGKVAPDLTHLASRAMIGANSFDNDSSDLEAWATHAQSFKPGALMPDLTAYTGEDLRELVAYLRQLK